jgi:YD repeat-containing protein
LVSHPGLPAGSSGPACGCGSPEYIVRAYGTAVQETNRWVYDYQGQPVEVHRADGTVLFQAYDPLGRLTTVGDGLGTTSHTYDNLSRLVAVSNAFEVILNSVEK